MGVANSYQTADKVSVVLTQGHLTDTFGPVISGGLINKFGPNSGWGKIGKNDAKINIEFPENDSKTKHIFREAEGHLADTPANRNLLKEAATDKSNYLGSDKYGNDWFAQTRADGSQVWVQTRNGVITNGGVNSTPKIWNNETGLNLNK